MAELWRLLNTPLPRLGWSGAVVLVALLLLAVGLWVAVRAPVVANEPMSPEELDGLRDDEGDR